MKRIVRNIIICVLAAAMVAALYQGLSGSKMERREQRCKSIEVEVMDSAVNKFLDGKEVVRLVDRDFGGYVNRYVDSIRLHKIESILRKKVFIKDCCAFLDKEGILHVKIRQYSPVLRIREANGTISYMDERGGYFPVESDWASGLKTADGVFQKDDAVWMSRLSAFALALDKNRRLSSMVTGIHCTPKSEIRLNLEGRNETFDIGTPTDLKVKFYRIEKYLDDIAREGNEYSEVSVKYEKQIICKIWKENTSLQ